jgi:hypothetical protein
VSRLLAPRSFPLLSSIKIFCHGRARSGSNRAALL